MGECMSGAEIDDVNNLARLCSPSRVIDGKPNGEAFRPRKIDNYLSVNWIEYFRDIERDEQIEEIRRAFISKDFDLKENAKFAVVNVGDVREYVRQNSQDSRALRVYREEDDDPQDPSHSGIHGYSWDDILIADLIAFRVQQTFPAKSE